jgi:hypothetical protein
MTLTRLTRKDRPTVPFSGVAFDSRLKLHASLQVRFFSIRLQRPQHGLVTNCALEVPHRTCVKIRPQRCRAGPCVVGDYPLLRLSLLLREGSQLHLFSCGSVTWIVIYYTGTLRIRHFSYETHPSLYGRGTVVVVSRSAHTQGVWWRPQVDARCGNPPRARAFLGWCDYRVLPDQPLWQTL